MANDDNLKLEILNAQIDIWIDDEAYDEIQSRIMPSETTGKAGLNEKLKDFFRKLDYCTHNEKKDEEWQHLLGIGREQIHTVKDVYKTIDIPIDDDWFHLLYAKLLWAEIQQRGDSDCYMRRLDNVVAYLERHLPQQNEGDIWATRLTLMYLMELSAVSQGSESQGYSERARRVIRDRKYFLDHKGKENEADKAYEKAPYEFYELWARYNIGVAHFHQRKYRLAVQEFNRIIWQVEKWKPKKDKDGSTGKSATKEAENREYSKFFNEHKGNELLLMPAKLYRAEVQLKLQMAYHTLDTLNAHETEAEKANKDDTNNYAWGSEHKRIKADIIRSEAYLQLGRLDKSWEVLSELYSRLAKKTLGLRIHCIFPGEEDITNMKFPGLGERFIDILVEFYLNWLLLEGEDVNIGREDLRHLVKYGKKDPCKDYIDEVDNLKCFLKKLKDAFGDYWKLVEHNAHNRRGYFQQVSKYLGWLAKAADAKITEAPEEIKNVAKDLFDKNRDGLLEKEPGLDDKVESEEKGKSKCQHCDPKGIDLRRIADEHYEWFTEAMLKFFNSPNIPLDKGEGDRKDFVKRLLKLERQERNDLRINDLELHYKYYDRKELLEKTVDWWKIRKGMELCWKGVSQKKIENFTGLLACAPKNRGSSSESDALASDDYEKIMKDWDDDFVRHLESSSVHKHDTKENQFYFVGLQRWNSSSPAKGYSVGGGYLLYHLGKDRQVDLGVAIDPGFDFVRNLFHSGFSLDDIDIVLISHAHVDHIRDFESIITLIYELKKRSKRERRVHVILSLGTYERLKHIIESPGFRYFIEPYVIDINREIDEGYFEKLGDGDGAVDFEFERVPGEEQEPNRQIERLRAILPDARGSNSHLVKIMPTRAYHNDYTYYSDSFGFLIELNDHKGEKITFGNTGDTKWVYPDMPDPLDGNEVQDNKRVFRDIADQYKDCDALVVHLGSLIKRDKDDGMYSFSKYHQCVKHDAACEEQVRDENHPYLVGMLRLLSSLASKAKSAGAECEVPLILVSEFGEELKGRIRTDFVQRLQQTYKNELAFLPVDVGTNIHLDKRHGHECTCKVWCVQCQKFVDIVDAGFEMYGNDNALYCVCKTCLKATPYDVLQTRLSKLYEVGYDIVTRTTNDK